jgi:hypothetical protein
MLILPMAKVLTFNFEFNQDVEKHQQQQTGIVPAKASRQSCYNGYSLFWSTQLQNRVPLPGESQEQCRKRVMSQCRLQWAEQTPEAAQMRNLYTIRAKDMNKRSGDSIVRQQKQDDNTAVVPKVELQTHLRPLNPKDGIGTFGIGDNEFGISKSLVEHADSESIGFVRNYNSSWRNRTGSIFGENKELQQARGVIRLSCMDEFGFCYKSLLSKDRFNTVLEQLKGFVRGHHRSHVKEGTKTSQGPQVSIPQPLLAAWNGKDMWLRLASTYQFWMMLMFDV